MSNKPFRRYDFDDGSIEWHRDGRAPYWRTVAGHWVIIDKVGSKRYSLDEWLALVELPEEEKLMLKLTYG